MAANSLAKIKKLQADALALWNENWTDEEAERQLSVWQKIIRFFVFVWRSFERNRCLVRASSLAYTTLLALVPVLAVAISISTGLLKGKEGEEMIEKLVSEGINRIAPQLRIKVPPPAPSPTAANNTVTASSGAAETSETSSTIGQEIQDNRTQIAGVISSSIQNVQSGTLGALSGLVLVLIAVSLLSTIETTLNDIWGVARGRSWLTRVIYYWAVITLGPILLLSALGLSAGPYFDATKKFTEQFPLLSSFTYSFLPVLVLVIAFAAFYFLMPNTKVEWRAALVGGIVGGGLLQLNNEFSSIYFGQVVRQNKLWGGLGSVPVFLVGLYFSWIILLLGAQVAYAFQNRRSYFQEKQANNINQRGREFVALRIMTYIAGQFRRGERPATACEIADAIGIPSRLVSRTLEPLVQTRLVIEVIGSKKDELGYTPGRPLNRITYQNVLDALRCGVGQTVATKLEPERELVQNEFERIQMAEREVAETITLDHLVNAMPALKAPPQREALQS